MDCLMIKTLRGTQVGVQCAQDCFTISVSVGGQHVWALVDTGCGHILVKRAKGPWTPEILQMKCIGADVRECQTKQVCLWILRQIFTCPFVLPGVIGEGLPFAPP